MDSLENKLLKLKKIADQLADEDKTFLMSLNEKLQQQASDIQLLEEINEKKDSHLVRNGKEIMALTHEKTLLEEVIHNASNKEQLLKELEELRDLPLV